MKHYWTADLLHKCKVCSSCHIRVDRELTDTGWKRVTETTGEKVGDLCPQCWGECQRARTPEKKARRKMAGAA